MQKAFEKIVERLEEGAKHCLTMYDWQGQRAYWCAIEIVNQVAEQYEQEVCEWEFYHVSAGVTFFKTCTEVMPYIFKENKKYCPYCGKRIYVKGE